MVVILSTFDISASTVPTSPRPTVSWKYRRPGNMNNIISIMFSHEWLEIRKFQILPHVASPISVVSVNGNENVR